MLETQRRISRCHVEQVCARLAFSARFPPPTVFARLVPMPSSTRFANFLTICSESKNRTINHLRGTLVLRLLNRAKLFFRRYGDDGFCGSCEVPPPGPSFAFPVAGGCAPGPASLKSVS